MADSLKKFQRQVASFGKLSIRSTQEEFQALLEDQEEEEPPDGSMDPIGVPKSYSNLPLPIRSAMSLKQFMWLGDREKERIVETYCNPDPEEFGT